MVERRYYNRELETMSREDFLNYQWKLLQSQIKYTYEKSDLCKRKLKEAKITPDDIKTREDFRNKVPFTTKQDLIVDQQENPPYGARLAIPESKISFVYGSAGVTGEGQEVHTMNDKDREKMTDAITMYLRWADLKKGDRYMATTPTAFDLGSVALPWALDQLGVCEYPLGMYDNKVRIETAKRFKIDCFIANVAMIEGLVLEAEKLGIDLARELSVEKIIMIGPYPVSFAQETEKRWNTKLYEFYSSAQWGLASTCENGAVVGDQRGYMHLLGQLAYYEVIDPKSGLPVGAGEEGELVVTPFEEGSPFLRFRSGDKVRYFPHSACDCGRPFDSIEAGTVTRY